MGTSNTSLDRAFALLSSVKLAIVLLVILAVALLLGTVILQRPQAEPGQIERIYAPQTIRLLDFFGLFDVFHSWWFLALLALLALSITFCSIDRFPAAWEYLVRPKKIADENLASSLEHVTRIPLSSPSTPKLRGLQAAEEVLRQAGYKPQTTPSAPKLPGGCVFAQRGAWSRMAAYVLHVALLVILLGGFIDGVWGYYGYLQLSEGEQSNRVRISRAQPAVKTLPFAIRCAATDVILYPDGTPKQYWSDLVVMEDGREAARKRIEVNDPLVYAGLRFYQANFGSTGRARELTLRVVPQAPQDIPAHTFKLQPGEWVELDANARFRVAEFIPDFEVRGGRLTLRSPEPRNPALRIVLRQGEKEQNVFLFPRFPDASNLAAADYRFELLDVQMAHFTGLQVAYQPGQGLLAWGSVIVVLGLAISFFLPHRRFWAWLEESVAGVPTLVFAGHANKHAASFARQFGALSEQLRTCLGAAPPPAGVPPGG